MKPWITLASVATAEGALELRRRGDRDFLIVIEGRVLMTSSDRRSEEVLAQVACAPFADATAPRVLIGGLGMAYTLRAALAVLPASAQVIVAELTAVVEEWCRGPLAVLTDTAVADPRVRVVIDNVAHVIASAPRLHYQAIILDLYEGPYADDSIFGTAALRRTHAALVQGGMLAVWSEDAAPAFVGRLGALFAVETRRAGAHRSHFVFVGRKR